MNKTHQELIDHVSAQIEQMQEEWRQKDLDYTILISYIQPYTEWIGKNYPPEFWPSLILMMYQIVKKVLKDNGLTKEPQGDRTITLH